LWLLVTVVLAVGTGIHTSVIAVLDQALLRSVPYRQADSLVEIETTMTDLHASVIGVPGQERHAALRLSRVFSAVHEYHIGSAARWDDDRTGDGVLWVGRISPELLEDLGLSPLVGRSFIRGDENNDEIVLISEQLWRRRYGADRGVTGRVIRLDGKSRTIIGVVPTGFRYVVGWARGAAECDVWLPVPPSRRLLDSRSIFDKDIVARLRPGLSIRAGQLALDQWLGAMRQQRPDLWPPSWRLSIRPLGFNVPRAPVAAVLAAWAAVMILVAIIASNLANLLFIHMLSRRSELALRIALGARPVRLVMDQFIYACVFAGPGCAIGFLITSWLLDSLPRLLPATMRGWVFGTRTPQLEVITVLAAIFVTLLIAAGISCQAALFSWRTPARRLTATSRDLNPSTRPRVLGILQSAQIGLTTALLIALVAVGSGLYALTYSDYGYRASELAFVQFEVGGEQSDAIARATDELVARARLAPGVEAVTPGPLPTSGSFTTRVGRTDDATFASQASVFSVPSQYLETIGVQIVAGRTFGHNDPSSTVAVISESLAQVLRISINSPDRFIKDIRGRRWEVVGIAKDIRSPRSLTRDASYQLYSHEPTTATVGVVIVRSVRPAETVAVLRGLVQGSGVGMRRAGTIGEAYREVISPTTFIAGVGAVLSILGWLTACVGLYGLVGFVVALRTQEFGIRIALGATPGSVARLVFKAGMLPVLVGLPIGVGLGLLLVTALGSVMLKVTVPGCGTLAVACAAVVATALVAITPSMRLAARQQPVTLLMNGE
jgi:putative ABC transport system permease protein